MASLAGCRRRMCRVRGASRDICCVARTCATREHSTVALTGRTVTTGSRHVQCVAEGYRSRQTADSAAVTAVSRSRRVLPVAAGCRPGWAGTAASWDVRLGPSATTRGTSSNANGHPRGLPALSLGGDEFGAHGAVAPRSVDTIVPRTKSVIWLASTGLPTSGMRYILYVLCA